MVDALGSNEQGIDSRCDAATMTLSGEIDESASDVVVCGMFPLDDVSPRQFVESKCLSCCWSVHACRRLQCRHGAWHCAFVVIRLLTSGSFGTSCAQLS